MHWYKKNIGDYLKKAGRLSMLQHGAYTMLLDCCYDREKFPTLEQALDWTWASSQDEEDAVKFVLKKFFIQEGGVHIQQRVKEELAIYHEKAVTNKRIAQEREDRRKAAKQTNRDEKSTNRAKFTTNRERVVHEPPPNQEPVTSNHNKNQNTLVENSTESRILKCKSKYSPEFEHLWKNHPKREGKNSKHDANIAFKASLRRGKMFADIRAGHERYQVFVDAKGWQGSRHVSMLATFLGPSDMWAESWEIHQGSETGGWQNPPRNDDQLCGWAQEHGFPTPARGESSYQYRQRLKNEIRQRLN